MRKTEEILKRFVPPLTSTPVYKVPGFSFEIIGDIAIVKMPHTDKSKRKTIGEALLRDIRQIRVVLAQKGPIGGEYRIREMEHLAGEPRTTTIHKEYGCSFSIDLSRVYFSPRLSTERMRVADLVTPGEYVLNMFAGVSPFSILIAKKQPQCTIVEIELNLVAHELARKNAVRNKVSERIEQIHGDTKRELEGVKGRFDRVLIPLPESSFEFLESAIRSIKKQGGWIHFYAHMHGRSNADAIESARVKLEEPLRSRGSLRYSRVVKGIGPGWYQIVADLEIYPIQQAQ